MAGPVQTTAVSRGDFPAELARDWEVVPLRRERDAWVLLAADPERVDPAGELAFILGCGVRFERGEPALMRELLKQHRAPAPCSAGRPAAPPADLMRAETVRAGKHPGAEAPAIQWVSRVLAGAITEGASDIHFEPFEASFRIRYRVDGTLREVASPPRELAPAVASRLKLLANLDIAERRRPQDGRIRLEQGGNEVDLRVSTLPTQFGESVVLRVLDPALARLDLAALGLDAEVLEGLTRVLRRPSGLVLVTGPTGSGKTTTLYGALRAINTPGQKLLTIEDPVEYEIEGARQVPLNPAAGLTFASALRCFLRHDPDVIMVGEIRDLETAQISIQAALTGHLVLATMHTNDAPSAATRLLDMGVEPFLLTSTVEAILAQRLVRTCCAHCGEDYQPPQELLAAFGLTAAGHPPRRFRRGAGCARCKGTGYQGRMGLFEWLVMDDPLRELIARNAPVQALRDLAVARGMRPLRHEGARAVVNARTTLEEIAGYL